jgi:hypothetical protein
MEQDFDYVCVITRKDWSILLLCTAEWDGKIIMNGEWVKVWTEAVTVYFNIYALGDWGKSWKPQSKCPVTKLRFEPDIFQVQVYKYDHYTNLSGCNLRTLLWNVVSYFQQSRNYRYIIFGSKKNEIRDQFGVLCIEECQDLYTVPA